ncbi:hypothetical protein GAP31_189 [Cronobacter phage vB_CsaM_GAP31]|uniref:Uncharacterized protein n=1 Tax=Cronobacter phage vB_CsaM_GAP31 TaxID=1141135 RepID=K4F999_9CAUD|nr:hypothetical protein GAP31_189 [Cronobacter phage vB_CsaM_GAP31]AFC21370.1 hypothetical protein GAP31_189 [Cronobacter phage vB_CsaM_GAP31]
MSDSKTVISVTERATKAVATAATGLSKVVSELQSLAEGSERISQEIQFKQQELGNIEVQFNEKLAEEKSKLKIKVLENEDGVLSTLLKARGLVAIEPGVVDGLRNELAVAQDSNEDAITAAVDAAKRSAAIELNAVKSNLESAHKVAIAELNANTKADKDRIAMLTEQLEAARADLKAERETRLEIAKADANRQGVVVNTGKN